MTKEYYLIGLTRECIKVFTQLIKVINIRGKQTAKCLPFSNSRQCNEDDTSQNCKAELSGQRQKESSTPAPCPGRSKASSSVFCFCFCFPFGKVEALGSNCPLGLWLRERLSNQAFGWLGQKTGPRGSYYEILDWGLAACYFNLARAALVSLSGNVFPGWVQGSVARERPDPAPTPL